MADRPLFIRLSMPSGLEDALEGLAREVLRSQPKDMLEFSAQYFEGLLRTRNKDLGLPEDDLYGLMAYNGYQADFHEEPDEDMPDFDDPQYEKAATKIQAGFRGSKARKEVVTLKQQKQVDIDEEDKEDSKKSIDIKMPTQDEPDDLEVDTEVVEEEIDIDLEDPEVEAAATKIQASFKGHKARKEVSKMKETTETTEHVEEVTEEKVEEEIDIDLEDPEVEAAATKIQASFKGHKARKEVSKMKETTEVTEHVEEITQEKVEEEIDIDLEDPEVEAAATKIQASFKGHKARKEVSKMKETSEVTEHVEEVTEEKVEEEIDIDLEDPEVEAAATKIQASFKGHKARKEVSKMKETTEVTEHVEEITEEKVEEEIDIDLEDPEVAAAATKIQAGYKGMRVRKELKSKSDVEEEVIKDDIAAEEEIDIDLEDPEVEAAATKIQASFKGHKARKELKEGKKTEESNNAGEEAEPVNDVKNETNVEEEIDIDLDDPEVAAAATKIQAGYKGMKVRKGMKEKETEEEPEKVENTEDEIDIDLNDPEVEAAATKIQASFKGHKTRKELKETKTEGVEQKVTEEEVTEVQETDAEMELAATRIQAGYKGMKVRHEIKQKKEAKAETDGIAEAKEEEIDIDLEDPEVEAAATKIQASFKGHKARKELKEVKKAEDTNGVKETETEAEAAEAEDVFEEMENDPEKELAATRIQAGYKGMKTRKEMKKKTTEENEAATKIQAGYKGMRTRKEMRRKMEGTVIGDPVEESTEGTVANGNTEVNADNKIEMLGELVETQETLQEEAEEETGEKIDINIEDPEVEVAATKIQAGYKGMKTRKELKEKKMANVEAKEEEVDIDLEDPEVNAAATKIQAGYKGMKVRKDLKSKSDVEEEVNKDNIAAEEEIDIDLEDPEVEAAATKIQASFKGHKARKELKEGKKVEETVQEDNTEQVKDESEAKEGEEIDIDLEDPEVAAAATKIQAGYKGMKVRKEIKQKGDGEKADKIDIDLEDPEVEVAATKIQAGYKGMKVRKEMRDRNEADGSEAPLEIKEEAKVEEATEEEIDIDLDDPEVAAAATKIQASFKGHKTRKELKESKPVEASEAKEETNEEDQPELAEESTELLIQGQAEQAQDQDVRPETADDGYTSPELTLTSSVPGSPQKSMHLELTGTAAPIHDPNSEMLSTMMSQESVTDSELMEMNFEFGKSMDDVKPYFLSDVLQEELMEEDNGSSKLSSMVTVANAEEEVVEEEEQGDELMGKIIEQTSKTPQEDQSHEQISLDQPEEVAAVGAVPFEEHEGHPQVKDLPTTPQESSDIKKANEEERKEQIMLYYSKGSYTSEKVLVYLYEREIDFTSFNVDLSQGEQFSKWFLKLNPKGEVPVLTIRDPTKEPSDPRHLKIITESTRILHTLDSKFTDLPGSPNLVPSSSDTIAYQHHVYFTAIFDQIPLNILSHGIAFHDHLAIEPESPYILENYDSIREVVLNREEILNEAALAYAAYIGSDTDTAVMELRRKASSHKYAIYQYTTFDEYKKLLKRTSATLDKAEAQLKKTMAGNSEDDCEGWLLSTGFGVVDIILGVLLQRLAKLGLRHYFWSHGKRPFIHKFIRQIQQRRSFVRAIQKLPLSEISGPKPRLQTDSSIESRFSLDEMEAYVQVETSVRVAKKPPPLRQKAENVSMEVFNVLHDSKVEDEKADGTYVKKRSNWKQLWVSNSDSEAEQKSDV